MSMKFRIDGNSSMEITDDNDTIVSPDMKEKIEDQFQQPDGKDNAKPNITIKD